MALLLTALALLSTGCGRTYHIKGRVVFLEEIESPESVIAEITGQQMPLGGVPIEGAKIRMIHQLDESGKPREGTVWQRSALSDVNGYFEVSDYAAPYDNVPVALEVSKEGYKTAFTVYIDYLTKDEGEKMQTFFVVLARDASNKGINRTRPQRSL